MADFLSSGSNDEIDFDRAASAFPDISLDGSGDFAAIPHATSPVAPIPSSSGFSFDDFDTSPTPAAPPVKVTGDDEIEKFESEFPDIEVPSSVPVMQHQTSQSSFGGAFAPLPHQSAVLSTPTLVHEIPEEEPEVIKEWRRKQAEEIAARDEASKKRQNETIAKAEKAIDDFYEEYAAKKERNIRENKDSEADYVQSLTESLSVGTTWERICKLVELENSQSKTIARTGAGTTDITRFKEVLLRLKREGDMAPGAAGY
ncbi:clathrin light chain-domain-containing protein [Rhodocollybia butyracea]|uniref:Clathrin light chain n=1 Tax=Rhodocollybia butyracea TaxID=206335 RepID=A0A9P5U777_9AGAR|nr:clathrin light chain-domain-containing protein [Rhodocollybia butyracea]